MTGEQVLAAVPRQRQPVQPVVAVRSDPLSSPLSLMVLSAPARPTAGSTPPLAALLPIQRDRRLGRSAGRGLLALAVAGGFATVLWVLIAGSAMALGRTL